MLYVAQDRTGRGVGHRATETRRSVRVVGAERLQPAARGFPEIVEAAHETFLPLPPQMGRCLRSAYLQAGRRFNVEKNYDGWELAPLPRTGGAPMRAVAQCRIEHRALSTVIPFLSPSDPFPPVEAALQAPNGLLAAGGDLSPERLLAAYAEGIFPWFGEDDPILWWSPDPRMVLYAREVHVARSLRKVIKSGTFRVTLDTAFPAVVRA